MNQVTQSTKLPYILQQADNCLILGQRLSEWCGHGP
ncbi:MAG: Phenylacetic acid catabolic protein, partial [Bacteroidota bacterium]